MSAQGDSMPPHENGSYIVVRYIEKLDEIVNKKKMEWIPFLPQKVKAVLIIRR